MNKVFILFRPRGISTTMREGALGISPPKTCISHTTRVEFYSENSKKITN